MLTSGMKCIPQTLVEGATMTVIKLKTDGELREQAVEKHESQIEMLVPFEEEKDRANEASRRALWDAMRAEEEDSAEAERRLAELERIAGEAEEVYTQACRRSRDLVDETVITCIEVVVELIHDNIDTLDGMNINSKTAFLAINWALPENIYVETNGSRCDPILYVCGSEVSQSVGIGLQPGNIHTHIMCCNKDGHFIDRDRFLGDYVDGVYRFESK